MGHHRREVVHQRGGTRGHYLRDVHERHVRGAARFTRNGDSRIPGAPQSHSLQRRPRPARPPARTGGRGQGLGATPPRRGPHSSRQSHGKVIAEHEMVQEAIADSYAEINMLRLLVLWTAWTIDNSSTKQARTQIAACKYTCAKVLREVSYRALHIMGSLGTTDLTPLQAMWAAAPTMAIADGVDEVHKVTVARNVLKDYQPHPGLWPTEYLPAKREEARKKYADLLAGDPDLAAWADH